VEKECVWAWSYVSNNGYNIKGMRAKTDLRGVRQVIRGNSVVMLEVWIPEPALFFSLYCNQRTQKTLLGPQREIPCVTYCPFVPLQKLTLVLLQALERIGGDRDRG
jgi:hypothetical protein